MSPKSMHQNACLVHWFLGVLVANPARGAVGREADFPPKSRFARPQLLPVGLQGVREEVEASWRLAPEFPQGLPQVDMVRTEGGYLLAFDLCHVSHTPSYHKRECFAAWLSLALQEEHEFWLPVEDRVHL